MPHAYSEDQLVEQPAIGLFATLGWQTVSTIEETFGAGSTLGRETKGEVVLVERLRVVDWEHPEQNDFLLVSQFSVVGSLYTSARSGWLR